MSEKEETPAASAASETGRWRLLFQRRIPWSRYPVFVINNGVFLPMFLMGLAGIATAFTCRRFRKQPLLWSLAGWLLGSYYLLTIALTFSTPRYAMQALPALALFSVLPLLAMPAGRLRRVLQGAYLAILLFQYGNLTVHAYGPIAEVTLPGQWDPEFQEIYDDPGLSVYKPVLHASSAYGRMQAPMTENFKDRLFRAMLKTEQERPFSGIEANYARLNIRGMLFEEQHYWLDAPRKNPFRRHDIPAELEPYRNFRHYGWGKEINQILPVLPIVDYVAYTTENVSEEKEQEWLRMLEGYGFDLVERFHENRFGMVSARYYGVLARKNVPPLPQVASARDLESLSLEGLYKIRYSKQFSRLPDALKTALIGRMNGLFRQAGKPIRLNDKVDFLGASVAHEQGDWYSINLIFRSSAQEKLPYRLMFQGIVTPEYMASQFNKLDGKHGQFRWTFEPSPSIPLWPENEYLLLRFPLNVKKIPYDMSFAFYLPGAGVWGDALKLGRIDFNSVALNR